MQQIGRNYYNPKDCLNIPQHRSALLTFLYPRTFPETVLEILTFFETFQCTKKLRGAGRGDGLLQQFVSPLG